MAFIGEERDSAPPMPGGRRYANEAWQKYATRATTVMAFYPFEQSKTLMQLGFEPIAPRVGKTWLGKPVLVLPNIFQYCKHVGKMDGGAFRGLTPKLIGAVLGLVVTDKLVSVLHLEQLEYKDKDENRLTDEEVRKEIFYNFKRDLILGIGRTIATYPFKVITIHMIAEMVGRDAPHRGMFATIGEIWKTQGLLGFYGGIIPELIYEVSLVTLTGSILYLGRKQLKKAYSRMYTSEALKIMFGYLLYPYQLVANIMTVNGSSVQYCKPPMMVKYANWYECYKNLAATNQLRRGSSCLFRSMPLHKSGSNHRF